MLIGTNNSVLYIYSLFAKVQEKGHTILFFVFFHTRPQALAKFDAKNNVLHINGEGYAKETKYLNQFGLQG